MNRNKIIKNIGIYKSDWKKLMNIKIDKDYESLADVVKDLVEKKIK